MAPRVSSYMSDYVIVARPTDNLAHIRRLMLRHMVSRIVIVDDAKKPVGIITLTDLVKALLGRYGSRPLNTVTAMEIMSRDVKTVTPRKSIKHAAAVMLKYKVGGLPVVDETGALKGIITRTDLARAFADHYSGKYTVGELAREAYAVANRYHAIFYVFKLANLDPAGKVIVVDEEHRPVGVITRRDLAFVNLPLEVRVARGKDRYRKRMEFDVYGGDRVVAARDYLVPLARDIMTPDPITVEPGMDAGEAARIMVDNGIGVLPVVDSEGKLAGVLTKLELMKVIVRD